MAEVNEDKLIHYFLLNKHLTFPKSAEELEYYVDRLEGKAKGVPSNPIDADEMLSRVKSPTKGSKDVKITLVKNDQSKSMARAAREGGEISEELLKKMHKDRFNNEDKE